MNNDINDLLKDRGSVYGSFADNASIAQDLKRVCISFKADAVQHEALAMILHKIARIVNGAPDQVDSWKDIAGYAALVVKDIEERAKKS